MSNGELELWECGAKKEDLRRELSEWAHTLLCNSTGAGGGSVAGTADAEGDLGGCCCLLVFVLTCVRVSTEDGESTRFREQQRSGWGTRVSGKKQRDLFFSLRHTSLLWYKSDQLVDFKGSTTLFGCRAQVNTPTLHHHVLTDVCVCVCRSTGR
jgi:hypothetical protein